MPHYVDQTDLMRRLPTLSSCLLATLMVFGQLSAYGVTDCAQSAPHQAEATVHAAHMTHMADMTHMSGHGTNDTSPSGLDVSVTATQHGHHVMTIKAPQDTAIHGTPVSTDHPCTMDGGAACHCTTSCGSVPGTLASIMSLAATPTIQQAPMTAIQPLTGNIPSQHFRPPSRV